MPEWMHHPVLVTLALLFVLGAVFMRGFSEVIGLAVVIVAVYLVLNAVVIAKGISADRGASRAAAGMADGAVRAARQSRDDAGGRA